MLKLVKWAFKLGQQTERARIGRILAQSRDYVGFNEMGTNEKSERAEINRKVRRLVNSIIDDITNPNTYEKESFSILYPKDDK